MLLSVQEGPQLFPNYEKVVQCSAESGDISASDPKSGSANTKLCVTDDTGHCTVKHHTDIINFACMTWKFVRISASLSALCTNFYQICHWHCISCKILPHFDVRTISVAQKL